MAGSPLPPPSGDDISVLRDAALRLHAEPSMARAVQWTLEAVAAIAGTADVALCVLADDSTPAWWSHARSRLSFSLIGDPRSAPLLAAALDVPGGVFYDDLIATEAQLPPTQRLRRMVPADRLLVVPVSDSSSLRGAIVATWAAGEDGPAMAQEVLAALAAHLGVAIDNLEVRARLAEEEARGKEVVHRLQQAVRPPAPPAPNVELGVHYVAADPSAPTGGDLYDWVVLPDGTLHVVVVDVMGKGVQATKDALMVTHALRLLAIEGCNLTSMVKRADELVAAQNPELVATLIVGNYDTSTGVLKLAGAGHPPAMIVSGGEVREVAAPGIPIGWPGAGSQAVVETTLGRSDTLILYTDGLIEARKDIVKGLAELAAAAAATTSYPARAMARVLIDRQLAGAMRHDDSVAMVLRRQVPQASDQVTLAPFQHRFTPHPAAVQLARHLLRDWLVSVPVMPSEIDGILLAASELCSNAVRHSSGEPASVVLDAWVESGGIILEVSDDGGGPLPASIEFLEVPDLDAERGRGLFLVRELMDAVATEVSESRTTVRATKRAVVADSLAPVRAP